MIPGRVRFFHSTAPRNRSMCGLGHQQMHKRGITNLKTVHVPVSFPSWYYRRSVEGLIVAVLVGAISTISVVNLSCTQGREATTQQSTGASPENRVASGLVESVVRTFKSPSDALGIRADALSENKVVVRVQDRDNRAICNSEISITLQTDPTTEVVNISLDRIGSGETIQREITVPSSIKIAAGVGLAVHVVRGTFCATSATTQAGSPATR